VKISTPKTVNILFFTTAAIFLGLVTQHFIKINNSIQTPRKGIAAYTSSLPAAVVLASNLTIPFDACPRNSGFQSRIPIGSIVDATGRCISTTVPVFYNVANTDTWISNSEFGLKISFTVPAGVVASTKTQTLADADARYSPAQTVLVENADNDHCSNMPQMQRAVPEGHYWTSDNKCFQLIKETKCVSLPAPSAPTPAPNQNAALYNACPGGIFQTSWYYIDEAGQRQYVSPQTFNQGISTTIAVSGLSIHVQIQPRVFLSANQTNDKEEKLFGDIMDFTFQSLMARMFFSPFNIGYTLSQFGVDQNAGNPISKLFVSVAHAEFGPISIEDLEDDLAKITAAILVMDGNSSPTDMPNGKITLEELKNGFGTLRDVVYDVCRRQGGSVFRCNSIAAGFNLRGIGLNLLMLKFIGQEKPEMATREQILEIGNRLRQLATAADKNGDGMLDESEMQVFWAELQKLLAGKPSDEGLNKLLNEACKQFIKDHPAAAARLGITKEICDARFPVPKGKGMEAQESEGNQNNR
jgi:hypothetical protein